MSVMSMISVISTYAHDLCDMSAMSTMPAISMMLTMSRERLFGHILLILGAVIRGHLLVRITDFEIHISCPTSFVL